MPKREGSPLLPSLLPAKHAKQQARRLAPAGAPAAPPPSGAPDAVPLPAPAPPAPAAAAAPLSRFALPAQILALVLRRLRQPVTLRDGPASPAAPWSAVRVVGGGFRARRLARDACFCSPDALRAARNRKLFAEAVAGRLREFQPDASAVARRRA